MNNTMKELEKEIEELENNAVDLEQQIEQIKTKLANNEVIENQFGLTGKELFPILEDKLAKVGRIIERKKVEWEREEERVDRTEKIKVKISEMLAVVQASLPEGWESKIADANVWENHYALVISAPHPARMYVDYKSVDFGYGANPKLVFTRAQLVTNAFYEAKRLPMKKDGTFGVANATKFVESLATKRKTEQERELKNDQLRAEFTNLVNPHVSMPWPRKSLEMYRSTTNSGDRIEITIVESGKYMVLRQSETFINAEELEELLKKEAKNHNKVTTH